MLFVFTLFLLAFIPLYPKLPLLDVVNTWVYIRVEDVIVALTFFLWISLLVLKKVTLKTPLTLPILLFWIAGGLSTLHGVLLIFPTIANVFPNIAFLSMLRRMEYMSLFFVAYAGMKDKKFLSYVIFLLAFTLILIFAYGVGQKFLGFPAFLTMNEEFAKGVGVRLSQLSRVPSTFAGHYDLAAYLVMIIPLLVSVAFGFKNWMIKIFLLITSSLGFVLLFMTVSRVSFVVLLLSLGMLLIIQKKKLVILSLIILTLTLLVFSPKLLDRFVSTVSEVNVLVDAKTGKAMGHTKEVSSSYYEDKIVLRDLSTIEEAKRASVSAIILLSNIPSKSFLVVEPNSPTGENLPQGTSYVNLSLSPIVAKAGQYFYQKTDQPKNGEPVKIDTFFGDFVIKKAKAYDLSFTTRFQGEWPNALKAFSRNIFLGSGYGSVSLAVDNDYLRILGESGLIGFLSFISIFMTAFIYAKKILPKVTSPIAKNFVIGFMAGTFGLVLNAVFIDVFEASKVAFVFWALMGITLGILSLYKEDGIDFYKELKKMLISSYAVAIYLFIAVFALFSQIPNNYFVGDDFTWFRWIIDCDNCQSFNGILNYFIDSDGFFYRPGTKVYFTLMYSSFWLNQTIYHVVSLLLHFFSAFLIFIISKKILKNYLLSGACALIFIVLSSYHEAVFWISSTGFLFNAVFALLSLLFFVYWKERKQTIYFVGSIIFLSFSFFFHEVGVIVPFLLILYDAIFWEKSIKNIIFTKKYYLLLLFPLLPYLMLRFIASSHWFSGDYSYNILKFPFNFFGNILGYIMLELIGPSSFSFYEKIRIISRDNILLTLIGSIILIFIFVRLYKLIIVRLQVEEKRVVIFGCLFFIIALLPFVGLGNITSRYNYLPSFGFALVVVILLKKIYEYLLSNGKPIAIAGILTMSIIFLSFHLFQLQNLQLDWGKAGEKSKKLLTSLNYIYAHYPIESTSRLYLVDTPIRLGEAWVFPVGIDDAVWLVFRSNFVNAYQVKSLDQAFDLSNESSRVFKFDEEGSLVEMRRTKNGNIYIFK